MAKSDDGDYDVANKNNPIGKTIVNIYGDPEYSYVLIQLSDGSEITIGDPSSVAFTVPLGIGEGEYRDVVQWPAPLHVQNVNWSKKKWKEHRGYGELGIHWFIDPSLGKQDGD